MALRVGTYFKVVHFNYIHIEQVFYRLCVDKNILSIKINTFSIHFICINISLLEHFINNA